MNQKPRKIRNSLQQTADCVKKEKAEEIRIKPQTTKQRLKAEIIAIYRNLGRLEKELDELPEN